MTSIRQSITCTCGTCKKCKDRAYYQRHREKILIRAAEYREESREKINAWFREYRESQKENPEWLDRQREVKRIWAAESRYDATRRDREKIRARRTVQRLVREGKLTRGDCEVCGKPEAHAHHEDYSLPLEIRWFCPKHHVDHHRLAPCV